MIWCIMTYIIAYVRQLNVLWTTDFLYFMFRVHKSRQWLVQIIVVVSQKHLIIRHDDKMFLENISRKFLRGSVNVSAIFCILK